MTSFDMCIYQSFSCKIIFKTRTPETAQIGPITKFFLLQGVPKKGGIGPFLRKYAFKSPETE